MHLPEGYSGEPNDQVVFGTDGGQDQRGPSGTYVSRAIRPACC
jgi:hypothetical protein